MPLAAHSPTASRTADSGSATPAPKVGLAIITNCLTPYRIHLHQQIAAHLPEVELHTLITHGVGDFQWRMAVPPEINLVNFSDPDDSASYQITNSLGRLGSEWRKARRMADYLQAQQIRAVIGVINLYPSYWFLTRRLKSLGIKFFVNSDSNIHNERHLPGWKKALKRLYYRWWLSRTTGVLSMGRCGDEFFAQYWPHPERVYRFPYWPDLDFFAQRNEAAVAEFRLKHKLPAERNFVLYSGRLIRVKRVDLLIEAFAQLAGERPDWDLVIAGDGVLREQLEAQAQRLLPGRVHWTGFLEADELVHAYHSCHVLALPSDFEPWALVVCEALAAGLPVVASDVVGAAHELIEPGVSGELFAAGDGSDFAQKLRVVTDAANYNQYEQAARPAVERWRRVANPLPELRRALADAALLPQTR